MGAAPEHSGVFSGGGRHWRVDHGAARAKACTRRVCVVCGDCLALALHSDPPHDQTYALVRRLTSAVTRDVAACSRL